MSFGLNSSLYRFSVRWLRSKIKCFGKKPEEKLKRKMEAPKLPPRKTIQKPIKSQPTKVAKPSPKEKLVICKEGVEFHHKFPGIDGMKMVFVKGLATLKSAPKIAIISMGSVDEAKLDSLAEKWINIRMCDGSDGPAGLKGRTIYIGQQEDSNPWKTKINARILKLC